MAGGSCPPPYFSHLQRIAHQVRMSIPRRSHRSSAPVPGVATTCAQRQCSTMFYCTAHWAFIQLCSCAIPFFKLPVGGTTWVVARCAPPLFFYPDGRLELVSPLGRFEVAKNREPLASIQAIARLSSNFRRKLSSAVFCLWHTVLTNAPAALMFAQEEGWTAQVCEIQSKKRT